MSAKDSNTNFGLKQSLETVCYLLFYILCITYIYIIYLYSKRERQKETHLELLMNTNNKKAPVIWVPTLRTP